VRAGGGARRRAPPSFGSVLAEVEGEVGDPERIARPHVYPFAAVDPPGDAAVAPPASAWDQAFAWVETAGEPPADSLRPERVPTAPRAEPTPPMTDDPEAIAAELRLSDATTLAELRRVRRRFMWANHPDRRPNASRDLANRRVAIANMLIDRAEAALASPRRR